MTSHKINFTLPDMPNSINFQISFTVNSEESEPMLNVEHSSVNTQEVINLQDKSSDLDVKPLSLEDPRSLDECFENVSLCDKTKKDYKGLIKHTRARSAQFRLRRELPCTRVVQILPAAQTTRTRH